MKIYNNANLNHKHLNGVIAIGNFDGVHLGHQKVINEARQKAKKLKLPFGVMTFEPVPVMFFNKKKQRSQNKFVTTKNIATKKIKIRFFNNN